MVTVQIASTLIVRSWRSQPCLKRTDEQINQWTVTVWSALDLLTADEAADHIGGSRL